MPSHFIKSIDPGANLPAAAPSNTFLACLLEPLCWVLLVGPVLLWHKIALASFLAAALGTGRFRALNGPFSFSHILAVKPLKPFQSGSPKRGIKTFVRALAHPNIWATGILGYGLVRLLPSPPHARPTISTLVMVLTLMLSGACGSDGACGPDFSHQDALSPSSSQTLSPQRDGRSLWRWLTARPTWLSMSGVVLIGLALKTALKPYGAKSQNLCLKNSLALAQPLVLITLTLVWAQISRERSGDQRGGALWNPPWIQWTKVEWGKIARSCRFWGTHPQSDHSADRSPERSVQSPTINEDALNLKGMRRIFHPFDKIFAKRLSPFFGTPIGNSFDKPRTRTRERTISISPWIWTILLLAASLGICLWAQARTALLGLMAGGGVACISQIRLPLATAALAGIMGLIGLSPLVARVIFWPEWSLLHSCHERFLVWKMATDLWLESPLWGLGPAGVTSRLRAAPFTYSFQGLTHQACVIHPHNFALELLASWGIGGTVLVVGFAACALWRTSQTQPNWATSLTLALVTYGLVVGSFYTSLFQDDWFVGWMGALLLIGPLCLHRSLTNKVPGC